MSVDTEIRVIPTSFRMTVRCANCGERYIERPRWHEDMVWLGIPSSLDPAAWRRYLIRLGWTREGTVCLACSRPKEPDR